MDIYNTDKRVLTLDFNKQEILSFDMSQDIKLWSIESDPNFKKELKENGLDKFPD